ncbi:RagB/SusD family nutrient uptake outer membrane protein [Pedobacter gandavensis]|uniref:RagB/SusD family nutrient uptake outer membrane protein n=1 Tax=Pedobacter gandavensis TaxID=2679963 RepID=UPI00292DB0EF|nr:RagB/SusD family nutrient uptake outer membrane protein [Pedobacter gandavensis]
MRNQSKYLIVVLAAVLAFSSCKKFLDVQPEDRLTEDQAFSSKKNVDAGINGLYLRASTAALYGEKMTMSTTEILAQRYNIPATHSRIKFSTMSYTDATVDKEMEAIWTNAYSIIFNSNLFRARLKKSPGILDAKTDSVYQGEALAIRAMLHFDMLRLFGPMYNSKDSVLNSIPYCSQSEAIVTAFLPANVVMGNIVADLKQAERLITIDQDKSFDKKYRFNYYSIKALQARVYLYRGDKTSALAASKVLIDNQERYPWVLSANLTGDKTNSDRIFSTEMILGIYNSDLYPTQQKIFGADVLAKDILAPIDVRLLALYESNTLDYRYGYTQLWRNTEVKSFKTFFKYTDVDDKSKPWRNTIPLLKISEMYYIAAECEPNKETAIGYLNKVRLNRNIGVLPVTTTDVQLKGEILKEYQKEFFGEGQLFFYYKRTNATSIPNGSAATGTIAMDPVKYVVLIPQAEISNRN